MSREKQTSSKQWNIPMLNARKHVQDNNTPGKVPSRLKNGESSCKRYIKRLCLARHETRSVYVDDNQSQGSWHKAQ